MNLNLDFDYSVKDTSVITAYDVAVEQGFVGTKEEWLESLHGKDGYTPIKGIDYWTDAEKDAILEQDIQPMAQSLKGVINEANDTKEALENDIATVSEMKEHIDATVIDADEKIESLANGVESATTSIENLGTASNTANSANTTLTKTVADSETARGNLEQAITNAETTTSSLDGFVATANEVMGEARTLKTELDTSTSSASTAKTELNSSIATANTTKTNLDTANEAAVKNIQDIEAVGTYTKKEVDGKVGALSEYIDTINTTIFKKSINLFDKASAQQDKALATWGTPTTENCTYSRSGWFTSNVINVTDVANLYFTNRPYSKPTITNAMFFDSEGEYISHISVNANISISIPSGANYVVIDSNVLKDVETLIVSIETYEGAEYVDFGDSLNFTTSEDFKKLRSEVETLDLPSEKAHVLFSFDGFAVDNRFDLMKSYKFPFTIALNQNTVTYPLGIDKYNTFIRNNVDFSVYGGKGTIPSSYTDTSLQGEWDSWIENLTDGLETASGLFYPIMYSCANNKVSDILINSLKKKDFKMCRCADYLKADGTTEWLKYTRGYLFDGASDYMCVPLCIMKKDSFETLEQIKAVIDNAIANKKSVMLFTHFVKETTDSTIDDYDAPLDKFTAVLDYVKEKETAGLCDVLNARQYYALYNMADGRDIDYKRNALRINWLSENK